VISLFLVVFVSDFSLFCFQSFPVFSFQYHFSFLLFFRFSFSFVNHSLNHTGHTQVQLQQQQQRWEMRRWRGASATVPRGVIKRTFMQRRHALREIQFACCSGHYTPLRDSDRSRIDDVMAYSQVGVANMRPPASATLHMPRPKRASDSPSR